MPRAFSISTEAIAAERARVGGDLDKIDISRVVELDTVELRPKLGPSDVRLKILAVSGEHNINHAALADTVNIAEIRGGKIFPGNSALGEVVEIGDRVTKFKAGDVVVTHCNGAPDIYGYPLRIWAYDSRGLDRVVRRGGRRRRVAARARAARLRARPLADGGAAAPRADRLSPVAPRARHLPPQGEPREARAC